MQFRSACLGLALLMLGCTAKSPPDETEPAPELIVTGERVVLDRTASVYFDREDTEGMSLAVYKDASTPGHTFEVLTVTDARVEVRTIGPDRPPSCAGNFDFVADDYELRFWVKRADLRRVLVTPEAYTFADGTKLELRPGVPVIDAERGELAIGGQSLFASLERAELGLSFPAPEAIEFAEAKKPLRADALLHYGETSPALRVAAPFESASELIELEDQTDKLLVFDNACGRFTLRSDAKPIKEDVYAMRGPKDAIPRMARNFDPKLGGRPGAMLVRGKDGRFTTSPYGAAFNVDEPVEEPVECTPLRWTIASGVPLTWAAGGQPAGFVRRAHELPDNARELEKRVCFELEPVGLGLCADANKLARNGDPECPTPD